MSKKEGYTTGWPQASCDEMKGNDIGPIERSEPGNGRQNGNRIKGGEIRRRGLKEYPDRNTAVYLVRFSRVRWVRIIRVGSFRGIFMGHMDMTSMTKFANHPTQRQRERKAKGKNQTEKPWR